MYIGYMGDIVFAVSVNHMITPTNYERESDARWAEHNLLLRKPVSQFGGPGLEKVSFDIILDAGEGTELGLNYDAVFVSVFNDFAGYLDILLERF